MFYTVLKHMHSIIRWLVLLGFLVVIIRSAVFLIRQQRQSDKGRKAVSLVLSLIHIQVLVGIILYFISPKVIFAANSMSNSLLRFYLIEHSSLMVLSAVFATVGTVMSKRTDLPGKKHTRLFIFYLIGFILMLFAIPWPWLPLSGSWF